MPDSDMCELCHSTGGEILFQHSKLRVVLVDDALHPGFCRVVWQTHEREMTDLVPADRALFMNVVWQVEQAMRTVLQPQKINIASLGNLTPHLHWHVIARNADDAHFPQPVWGVQQRVPEPAALAAIKALLPQLRKAIAEECMPA
ncbi:MAG: HIT family protein [Pseudomonadota bacterium]